jgi:hypothetical protein
LFLDTKKLILRSSDSMVRVMVFNTTFNNISVIIVVVSFIGGGNRRKSSTCRKSMTIFMTYCYIGYTSPRVGFDLADLVVIGTYYTGSCTSNYHTITTTTAFHHILAIARRPWIVNTFFRNSLFNLKSGELESVVTFALIGWFALIRHAE